MNDKPNSKNELRYIAIEGVIGAGKRVLQRELVNVLMQNLSLSSLITIRSLKNFILTGNALHFRHKCFF